MYRTLLSPYRQVIIMDYRGAGLSKVFADNDPWDYFKQVGTGRTGGQQLARPPASPSAESVVLLSLQVFLSGRACMHVTARFSRPRTTRTPARGHAHQARLPCIPLAQAEAVLMLADALNIPRFNWVGWSSGGDVGLVLAALHSRRLGRMVSHAGVAGGKNTSERGGLGWPRGPPQAACRGWPLRVRAILACLPACLPARLYSPCLCLPPAHPSPSSLPSVTATPGLCTRPAPSRSRAARASLPGPRCERVAGPDHGPHLPSQRPSRHALPALPARPPHAPLLARRLAAAPARPDLQLPAAVHRLAHHRQNQQQ